MREHLAYLRSQILAGEFALVGSLLVVQKGMLKAEVHPAWRPDTSCVQLEYAVRQ